MKRCEAEKQQEAEKAYKHAAARMAALAKLLFEKGCYDVYPRALVEAEALARRAPPEEVAYYQCLIRCLTGKCRLEDCLRELGFNTQRREKS